MVDCHGTQVKPGISSYENLACGDTTFLEFFVQAWTADLHGNAIELMEYGVCSLQLTG